MTGPVQPPAWKNPPHRIKVANLPPAARSRRSHGFTRAAAEGRFMLQRCEGCGGFCYPAREACPSCLSAELLFVDAPCRGTLLAETTARVPADLYFRERAPWRLGLVRMDCGPTIVAHLHADCKEAAFVHMSFQLDKCGQAVAFARPVEETPEMADDRQWRQLTSSPKSTNVLVTNGRSSIGQHTVAELKAAGARKVFVGISEPWRPFPAEAALRGQDGIQIVSLDASDGSSCADLARELGGKIDILINTEEHIRPGGLLDANGIIARDETGKNYAGLANLARAFGPAMRARGADGINRSVAWVNVLSIYALANWPAFGTYSSSQAACLSLSHCLRAELRQGGVRLVNLLTGPVDNEWFQTVPHPKVSPGAIAKAIVSALTRGLEDVYVGEVAEELRRRLESNPKALEREMDR